MSLPLIFRPEAQADLLEARDWYEGEQAGLGKRFGDAAEDVFNRIEVTPEAYAVVSNGVRRVKLRKFPYVVYYRVLSDRVEVIGVLHGARDPKVWQRRV